MRRAWLWGADVASSNVRLQICGRVSVLLTNLLEHDGSALSVALSSVFTADRPDASIVSSFPGFRRGTVMFDRRCAMEPICSVASLQAYKRSSSALLHALRTLQRVSSTFTTGHACATVSSGLATLWLASWAQAGPLVLEETFRIEPADSAVDITFLFSWDYTQHSSRIAVSEDDLILTGVAPVLPGEVHPYVEHAWSFRRSASGAWNYSTTLKIGPEKDHFSAPMGIAIDGDLAVAEDVFERTSTGWQQVADFRMGPDTEISNGIILDSDATGLGYSASTYTRDAAGTWFRRNTFGVPDIYRESDGEYHGPDLDIHGTQAILAAPIGETLTGETARPTAHIFSGGPSSWTRTAVLSGVELGTHVTLEDDTAVVDGFGAHVFSRDSSGSWNVSQVLQSADQSQFQAPYDLDLEDGLLAISYRRSDQRGNGAGSIAIWQRDSSGIFSEVARLVTSNPEEDRLGYDIDLDGRRLVATGTGAAYGWDLPVSFAQPNMIIDDFEMGGAENWTILPGSSFSLANGNGSRVYRQSSLAGDAAAYLDAALWRNQAIEADVRPTAFAGSNRWFGLVVRRSDEQNYYYMTVRQSNVVDIRKMMDGAYRVLASAPLPVSLHRAYRLRFEAIGTRLRAFVDNEVLVETTDDSFVEGTAGIRMYRARADFDNVIVSPNPQFVLYANDLEQDDWDRWTHTGEGSWSRETNGSYVYLQSSLTTPTGARAVAGVNTDNQVIEARVKAVEFGSSNNAWFGLMARYIDDDNLYYVTTRKSGTISLRKLVNGSIHELDSAPLNVRTGRWYKLRLETVDDRLRVYVDGIQVLEARDETHERGRYGLMTYRTAAAYDDVLVTQP